MWPWITKPAVRVIFSEIEIYTSSESWKNKLISLMYGLLEEDNIWTRYNYLKI